MALRREDVRRRVGALLGKPLPLARAGLRDLVADIARPGEPEELSTEEQLLLALLWLPYQTESVAEELPAEAFVGTAEREVYEAILLTYPEDPDVDLVSLGMHLESTAARDLVMRLVGRFESVPWLLSAGMGASGTENALDFAREIAAAWGDATV